MPTAKKENNEPVFSELPLFRDLPQEAQKELFAQAKTVTKRKDHYLFYEGEMSPGVVIIRHGLVKTCRFDADGEEHILNILHDGQSIFDDNFEKDQPLRYSAICMSNTEVCIVRREDFLNLLKTKPELSMDLITLLSSRLADAEEKILLLSTRDPYVRLAGFLLERDEKCVGPEIHLKLNDIAASIGLRPETISRNLSQFERKGYIHREGQGRILVTNRAKLMDIFTMKTKEE